jgi:hypothetical protein
MIPAKKLPSQELLKRLFEYSEEEGNLLWKNPPRKGKRLEGVVAGCIGSAGYRQIKVNKTLYAAHRLVWMWAYGEDPLDLQLDHIDGNKDNNRLSNLRKVTSRGNMTNLPYAPGQTGVLGVIKLGEYYVAQISQGPGKPKLRKYYSTLEEATEARKQMELSRQTEVLD